MIGELNHFAPRYFAPHYFGRRYFSLPYPLGGRHMVSVPPALRMATAPAMPREQATADLLRRVSVDPVERIVTAPPTLRIVIATAPNRDTGT